MSPTVDAKVISPTSIGDKVQDGRVQKPKTKKKDGIVPNYSINGRTFACEGCKNGHRVSKCTHAAQRPVHMTNDPGRPSADQKRHCDCPRTCQCTKKNCKCDRKCNCMQAMYMLVYVPMGANEAEEEKQTGEWQIGRTVITDLKGKELTNDEIKLRKQEKLRQQQRRTSRTGTLGALNGRPPSQGSTTTSGTPVSVKSEEFATLPVSMPKSGCCQNKNIPGHQPIVEVKNEQAATVEAKRSQRHCNCGDDCACAICLVHPNNATSQRIVQQRAVELSNNALSFRGNAVDQSHRTRPEEKGLSCMGTNPQFAWHTDPNPSAADLQTLFGTDHMADSGYYISYPVHGYSLSLAPPKGTCCSSSMPPDRRDLSSNHGSSRFLPFVGPNVELLSPPHDCSNEDFAMTQGLSEQATTQSDFQPSLGLSDDIFPPEPYVGQATVAGVYGMGDNWPSFTASRPIPQPWSSTNSDLEPSCIAPSVVTDFGTNAASLSTIAPPGTVNHFNTTAATMGLPPKPQTFGRRRLPGYEAQYHHQSLAQDPSFKSGYSSMIAPPSTYTPADFATLEPMDFFIDGAASAHAYSSPDVGVKQAYPP
jgi:hypothetical protein